MSTPPRVVRVRGRLSSVPKIPSLGEALAALADSIATTKVASNTGMTKTATLPGTALKRALATRIASAHVPPR
jgi:hypothetical protein